MSEGGGIAGAFLARLDAVVERAQKENWTVKKARAELAGFRRNGDSGKRQHFPAASTVGTDNLADRAPEGYPGAFSLTTPPGR